MLLRNGVVHATGGQYNAFTRWRAHGDGSGSPSAALRATVLRWWRTSLTAGRFASRRRIRQGGCSGAAGALLGRRGHRGGLAAAARRLKRLGGSTGVRWEGHNGSVRGMDHPARRHAMRGRVRGADAATADRERPRRLARRFSWRRRAQVWAERRPASRLLRLGLAARRAQVWRAERRPQGRCASPLGQHAMRRLWGAPPERSTHHPALRSGPPARRVCVTVCLTFLSA